MNEMTAELKGFAMQQEPVSPALMEAARRKLDDLERNWDRVTARAQWLATLATGAGVFVLLHAEQLQLLREWDLICCGYFIAAVTAGISWAWSSKPTSSLLISINNSEQKISAEDRWFVASAAIQERRMSDVLERRAWVYRVSLLLLILSTIWTVAQSGINRADGNLNHPQPQSSAAAPT